MDEGDEIEDVFVEAGEAQVEEFGKLLLDQSKSVRVDQLESLVVKCVNILYQFRHNMNRVATIREISTTIARDIIDPL